MNTYEVHLTQQYARVEQIEADSPEEALRIALQDTTTALSPKERWHPQGELSHSAIVKID